MNNSDLLLALNEALKDFTNYSNGIDRSYFRHTKMPFDSIMNRGICYYFFSNNNLAHFLQNITRGELRSLTEKYLTKLLPQNHKYVESGHWFLIGQEGVQQRIDLLTKAIEYYKANPI